ncbi:MAG: cyclic nucleotide-binding domain-containing protein [Burkholderiales bacterium]|nr:cyclic nucleotide-binding domain-containing protein [Burkholderiales bacterium]
MNLTELFRFETDLLEIPAGKSVFKKGDPGDKMYVLMKGDAVVMVGHVIVERVQPGALLGELALIDNSPRTAAVLAVTDCSFLPIDVRRFRFLVEQTPNFALHVMKVMADRLRKMDTRLLEAQEV